MKIVRVASLAQVRVLFDADEDRHTEAGHLLSTLQAILGVGSNPDHTRSWVGAAKADDTTLTF
jgi:hypothetical protein